MDTRTSSPCDDSLVALACTGSGKVEIARVSVQVNYEREHKLFYVRM